MYRYFKRQNNIKHNNLEILKKKPDYYYSYEIYKFFGNRNDDYSKNWFEVKKLYPFEAYGYDSDEEEYDGMCPSITGTEFYIIWFKKNKNLNFFIEAEHDYRTTLGELINLQEWKIIKILIKNYRDILDSRLSNYEMYQFSHIYGKRIFKYFNREENLKHLKYCISEGKVDNGNYLIQKYNFTKEEVLNGFF